MKEYIKNWKWAKICGTGDPGKYIFSQNIVLYGKSCTLKPDLLLRFSVIVLKHGEHKSNLWGNIHPARILNTILK